MSKNILIMDGHPDASKGHFCHAIAGAYKLGAQNSAFNVKTLNISQINFPIIHTKEEFEKGIIPDDIKKSQDEILWANHIVIIYPLWLGMMPALLKAFFEQCFRYGFAIDNESKKMPRKLLKGRSARIIVTMGMPAFIYKRFFGAHGIKSIQKNILWLAGFKPVKYSLIGSVESSEDKRVKWLKKIQSLGQQGI